MPNRSIDDVREFTDDIENAFKTANTYVELKASLDEIPEFDKLRKRLLSIDSEDCYGPWLGGDYYPQAIRAIIKEWLEKKAENPDAANEKLVEENAALQRNLRIAKANLSYLSKLFFDVINIAFANRAEAGKDFTEDFNSWVMDNGLVIKEEIDKERRKALRELEGIFGGGTRGT